MVAVTRWKTASRTRLRRKMLSGDPGRRLVSSQPSAILIMRLSGQPDKVKEEIAGLDIFERFRTCVARVAICKTTSRAAFCHRSHSLSSGVDTDFPASALMVLVLAAGGFTELAPRVKQYPRWHAAISLISLLICLRSLSVTFGIVRIVLELETVSEKTSWR